MILCACVIRMEEVQDYAQFQSTENEALTYGASKDICTFTIILTAFWFFVSMTLILGVYGSSILRLGPNCSLPIKANRIFVEYVKVKQLDDTNNGAWLYSFDKDPPLDVLINSSEFHSGYLPARSDKNWIYFLNEGSQMNISIRVNSLSSSSLDLVIAEGTEGFAQSLDDPIYPNTILSRNIIHGDGMIQQEIMKSSNYYVSVGNFHSETLEMQLNLTIKALVYNTTKAYHKCSLGHGECNFKLSFPNGNAAVLTTPGSNQGTSSGDWYVELSYGPRRIVYIVGTGGITLLVFLAFHLLNNFQCTSDNRIGVHYKKMGSEAIPLLSHKYDDLSSWSSSYEFVSQDDVNMDDEQLRDGNIRRLCAICFGAQRNCFFFPCGHCVACIACGIRIAEAAAALVLYLVET